MCFMAAVGRQIIGCGFFSFNFVFSVFSTITLHLLFQNFFHGHFLIFNRLHVHFTIISKNLIWMRYNLRTTSDDNTSFISNMLSIPSFLSAQYNSAKAQEPLSNITHRT